MKNLPNSTEYSYLFRPQLLAPNSRFRRFCLDRRHFEVAAELHFHSLRLKNDTKEMRMNFDGYSLFTCEKNELKLPASIAA